MTADEMRSLDAGTEPGRWNAINQTMELNFLEAVDDDDNDGH